MAAARARLEAAGIAAGEAALDAELLARHVLQWDRAAYLARRPEVPPAEFAAAYDTLIARRTTREPVAYITGHQEFWGRDFEVAPGVLIPRPETELIVEEALRWARSRDAATPLRVVDVGTGSGCLAVTLSLEAACRVHATDISAAALAIARRNAERLAADVSFHLGSVLADVPSPADLIVSNPPYVTRAEYAALQPEVRGFEPQAALVAGEDGLDVVREVVAAAAGALAPGGRLLIEIGQGQDEAVARLVSATVPLQLVGVRSDLQGIPRTVVAARGPVDRGLTASE